MDDIEAEDALDFIFSRGHLTLDEGGALRVPKPKPLEIGENDQRHMYRARVLEGDLPLVLFDPILWGLIVEGGVPEEGEGASRGL
jgi:hypothetical protein